MTEAVETFDLNEVPTVAEYKAAFLACKSALKSKAGQSLPLDLVRTHYLSPNHTVTAAELAQKVGLANARAANLHYGNFAKALGAQLGRKPKFPISIFVKFTEGQPGEETTKWTLLPQVVQALEELSWVKPQS